MAISRMLVLSNALPGREDEYNEWYSNRHLADVVACPQMVSGQRFRVNSGDERWKYAAIYEIEGDVQAALASMNARAGTPDMPISDAMNVADVLMVTLEPITKLQTK
jgi:hypothetical protein